MFLIQIKTVVTISVMVLLGVGFTLAVKARLSDPTSGYELAARERGGVFLGVEGVVMQDRGKTCGPASLKMILDVYGKTATLRDLERCHSTRRWLEHAVAQRSCRAVRIGGRGLEVGLRISSQKPISRDPFCGEATFYGGRWCGYVGMFLSPRSGDRSDENPSSGLGQTLDGRNAGVQRESIYK